MNRKFQPYAHAVKKVKFIGRENDVTIANARLSVFATRQPEPTVYVHLTLVLKLEIVLKLRGRRSFTFLDKE